MSNLPALGLQLPHQAFLQLDMKLLRSFPCRPLVSACLEQSSDFAVRTTGTLPEVAVFVFVVMTVCFEVVAAV